MGLKWGEKGVVHAIVPAIINNKQSIKDLVDQLREITGGVPIGKIAAGKFLEKDLEILIETGVDFISIAGAEAGTKTPILRMILVCLYFGHYAGPVLFRKNKLKIKSVY